MNIKKILPKPRTFEIIVLVALLFLRSFNYYFNYILRYGFSVGFSVSPILYLLLSLVCLAFIVRTFFKKPVYIFLYAIVLILVLFSVVLFEEIATLFDDFFNPAYNKIFVLLFYCIPGFILGKMIKFKLESIAKVIINISLIVLLFGLIAYFFYVAKSTDEIEYMTFSYNLLFPTQICFSARRIIKEKKYFLHKVLSIFGTICIVFSGARGALICLGIFYIIHYLECSKSGPIKIAKSLLLLFLLTLLIIGFEQIINGLIDIANKYGITYLRTLGMLADKGFFTSDGRNERYLAVIDGLKVNPFGYGIFGNYHCVYLGIGEVDYCHNFLLEILCDFGLFLGPLFILLIACFTVKLYLKNRTPMVLSLITFVFISGLFSSSIYSNVGLAFFIGLLFNKHYYLKSSTSFLDKSPYLKRSFSS